MRSILPPVLSFLAFLAAAGCASVDTPGSAASGVQTASRASEIMRLRTRDGDVAVLAGRGGRRVTIYDASGVALRSAEIDTLRSTDPALFELLTTSTASSGAYVDATLHVDDRPGAPEGSGHSFQP